MMGMIAMMASDVNQEATASPSQDALPEGCAG